MKVLLINGSPHAAGCTFTALNEVAQTLNKEGIETQIIQVGHLPVRGCICCKYCYTHGKCAIDDIVNEVAPLLKEADGIVIGSPVYYASPNGTLISFLDRLFYSCRENLSMKVGAAVTSCRRGGNTSSFDVLNKYFSINNMPIATSKYWNMVYGTNSDEVKLDQEGL